MSYTNPFTEKRKENKRRLLMIRENNLDISDDKVIGLFCLQEGCSEKTARQYMKELKDAGVWQQ